MFNEMVINSYNLFTDTDIENFKNVGFIDEETYEKVKEMRNNNNAQTSNTN